MRIKLGEFAEIWGTVWLENGSLVYDGNEAHLRTVVEGMRHADMDDTDLLASLPRRLNSPYAWAVDLDMPAPPPPAPDIRPWEIDDWDEEMEAAANEARTLANKDDE